ncbi:hypothetical protein JB92DRAFT_1787051 [Gautieria morchelliformis]|nr:hypothetical protein JB92DRAFT_1787051 [Gautieria morchelliformis]
MRVRVRRSWTLFAACIDSGRGMSDVGTRADYDGEKKGSRSPLFMSSILNCPALITRPFDSRLPPRPTPLSFGAGLSLRSNNLSPKQKQGRQTQTRQARQLATSGNMYIKRREQSDTIV